MLTAPVVAAESPRPVKPGDSTPQQSVKATGFLGVQLDEVDEALTYHLGLANDLGVMITGVAPGGAGDAMGLKMFDVVVAAEGTPIYTPRALIEFIKAKSAGDAVKLTVRRGATSIEFDGTLAARPAEFAQPEGHRFPHQGPSQERRPDRLLPGQGPITGPGGQRRGTIAQPDGTTMEWSIDESPEPPAPALKPVP